MVVFGAGNVKYHGVRCPVCKESATIKDGGTFAYVWDSRCIHISKILDEYRRLKYRHKWNAPAEEDYLSRDDDDPFEPRKVHA